MNLKLLIVGVFCFVWSGVGFQNPIFIIRKRSASFTIIPENGVSSSSPKTSLSMSTSSSKGSSSSSSSSFQLPNRSRRTQHKDTVIIGSGLAGLSAALYLSQLDPDRHITILDRQEHDVESKKKTTISSFAAAGMLAPQSERLPKGHLLDLCLASRRMYPEFCDLVESMARESGEDGAKYLIHGTTTNNSNNQMDPWSVGYLASGGFLAPAFAGDSVATWAPPGDSGSAIWLDEIQVRELEPNLHPDVVGGWWFPEDASVDARRLTCSLHAACVAAAGVQFLCGKNYEVTSLDLNDGKCHGIWLKNGSYFKTQAVLVANGAWMRNLLPVPIEPHKGQSLSLKMPADRPPILRRVLFAQDSYIVPKADGHIVIGATVEAGSFDGNVTPAGLLHILTHALQLVPGLQNLPIAETWAGLRPTTPDKGPILGKSPWENLYLAGGYWRNGVLLAPKTAQLLACLMADIEMSQEDERLLSAFAWDRFTEKGGGVALAANTRYAASMHPIHARASGAGVAAAVGTELGSYSTAKVAKAEREKERSSLWGDDSDDAFERAAELGRKDATTFSLGNSGGKPKMSTIDTQFSSSPSPVFFPETKAEVDLSPENEEVEDSPTSDFNIASVYQSIKDNKAKRDVTLPERDTDDRPDPGFRIYHVDSTTGETREVPPYTSPDEFLASIGKSEKNPSLDPTLAAEVTATTAIEINSKEAESSYDEKSYDGYQAILEANKGKSRAEELEAMRAARMKNRLDQDTIDESILGANIPDTKDDDDETNEIDAKAESTGDDVTSAYKAILDNKSKKNTTLPETDSEETRPDPGFRIYHVDESGVTREVPPYTNPGVFLESITKEKKTENATSLNSDGINGVPMKAIEETKDNNGNSGVPKEETNDLSGFNGDHVANNNNEYNEKTYDGYQAILEANAGKNRADQLQAMRQARIKNRIGQPGINESKLG